MPHRVAVLIAGLQRFASVRLRRRARRRRPLANTVHLDFLGDAVAPPAAGGPHDLPAGTGAAGRGAVDLRRPPGRRRLQARSAAARTTRRPTPTDRAPSTPTTSRGRPWSTCATGRQTGDRRSRRRAYALLRGLTYLQTASGPNGRERRAVDAARRDPASERRPARGARPLRQRPSYWLARTVWALGEGYRAFRVNDPAFARLPARAAGTAPSVRSTARCSTPTPAPRSSTVGACRPGSSSTAPTPPPRRCSASRRTSTPAGRRPPGAALGRFGEGVAALGSTGGQTTCCAWPYGAVLPYALSRSIWHAWGVQMPAALAGAAVALDAPRPARSALADAASFTPHLLVAGGAGERLDADAD